jgi:hypothetical protein
MKKIEGKRQKVPSSEFLKSGLFALAFDMIPSTNYHV